jgi:hypothetical protein
MQEVMFVSIELEEHIETFKGLGRIEILQSF